MTRTALFVYGTLKSTGRSRHLLSGQEFAGPAETLPLYRLFDHGEHPCLVEDREHGVIVRGEIWVVNDATLARLDAYEEAPTYFRRGEILIAGRAAPVTTYLYQGDVKLLEDCGTSWPPSVDASA